MPPIRMKEKTLTTCTVWLDVVVPVALDVDALVAEYGPKARTQAFLIDYAIGNRGNNGWTVKSEVIFDKEVVKVPYYED